MPRVRFACAFQFTFAYHGSFRSSRQIFCSNVCSSQQCTNCLGSLAIILLKPRALSLPCRKRIFFTPHVMSSASTASLRQKKATLLASAWSIRRQYCSTTVLRCRRRSSRIEASCRGGRYPPSAQGRLPETKHITDRCHGRRLHFCRRTCGGTYSGSDITSPPGARHEEGRLERDGLGLTTHSRLKPKNPSDEE